MRATGFTKQGPSPREGISVRVVPLLVAAALALGGCQQQSSPSPEGVVQVLPAAVSVAPGGQVQFSVTSPWGTDVTWSVSPPSAGAITSSGLFTASSNPADVSLCTVVASLRSDASRVGLAVVVLSVSPPVTAVAASGQQQSAGGISVESVVAEPVNSVIARDASGSIENRGGFFPSGSATP